MKLITFEADGRTRAGIRQVLGGLGDAFAGRGQDLNTTFAALPALLPHLQRVMATLHAPSTRLPAFIDAIDRTVVALAPVARQQAHVFTVAGTTFGAISHDPRALDQTIAEGARTLRATTPELAQQRPIRGRVTVTPGRGDGQSQENKFQLHYALTSTLAVAEPEQSSASTWSARRA